MNVFTHHSYKEAIKERVQELKRHGKNISLRTLSDALGIQYTYLSKALSQAKAHLNEDHLFTVCGALQFGPAERDFIFLLRDRDLCGNTDRRVWIERRVQKLKESARVNAANLEAQAEQLKYQIGYLLHPMGVVVHAALSVERFRKNPRLLQEPLELSNVELKEILSCLQKLGFIRLDPQHLSVSEVNDQPVHLPKDHPLMRTHQAIVRQVIAQRFGKTCEKANTTQLMATFSVSQKAAEKIQAELAQFIRRIQEIAGDSRADAVYQLNIDLFPWVEAQPPK
jgi:uncharacterized protein (TIGR02147 family)